MHGYDIYIYVLIYLYICILISINIYISCLVALFSRNLRQSIQLPLSSIFQFNRHPFSFRCFFFIFILIINIIAWEYLYSGCFICYSRNNNDNNVFDTPWKNRRRTFIFISSVSLRLPFCPVGPPAQYKILINRLAIRNGARCILLLYINIFSFRSFLLLSLPSCFFFYHFVVQVGCVTTICYPMFAYIWCFSTYLLWIFFLFINHIFSLVLAFCGIICSP